MPNLSPSTHNPYIIDRPISPSEKLYGREKLFQFIQEKLRKNQQVIILHGQHCIGKSSILYHIPQVIALDNFYFVHFSLAGKSKNKLTDILYDLAQEIKTKLSLQVSIDTGEINRIIDQIFIASRNLKLEETKQIFATSFLETIFKTLNQDNIVLLIDEFESISKPNNDSVFEQLLNYFHSLIIQQKKLFIIACIGENIYDMSMFLSLFADAPYQEIELLNLAEIEQLIIEPVAELLDYQSQAIKAIFELSSGHPYFTQVLCFALFEQAKKQGKNIIKLDDVEQIIEQVLNYAETTLQQFYELLPRCEQIIFSAVAESQSRGNLNLDQLLSKYGYNLAEKPALSRAKEQLLIWNFLKATPQIQVTIELIHIWLLKRHPLKQEISQCLQVETLDCRFQQLTNLPPEIELYINLRYLDLRNNRLTTLSAVIGQLTNLASLNLIDNQLNNLPPAIGKLKNLVRLHLSYNQLMNLPLEIGNLINITELYLSHNRLESLPPEIGQLTQISQLSLTSNCLTTLPSEIGHLIHLHWLDLSSNQLQSLPAEIGDLTNLSHLNLSGNQLTTLPKNIKNLTNLNQIDLSNNNLATLPGEIFNLTRLTQMNVCSNQLQTLSHEIGYLTNLNQLNLSTNSLTNIPQEIGNLIPLSFLYLNHNRLTNIPAEIGKLTHLKELKLHSNQIKNIPPQIGSCKKLKTLTLGNNQLSHLPHEIIDLVQFSYLNELELENNLLPIPPEIIWRKHEPKTIIEYYQNQVNENKKPLNEAKVLLVGEGSVGKTSLVKRLLHDRFDAQQNKTDGINIQHWYVQSRGEKIKLNIWDFGGQEIYHATHQFFLTKRSLYILVLDARQNEEQNRLEYWLKIIQSYGDNSPVVIVGNKSDQHHLDINQAFLQTKYSNIKAIVSTSCKTGNGLEQLTHVITEEIDQLDHVRDPVSLEWLIIKNRLEVMKQRQWDFILYKSYQQMCEEEKIINDQQQRILIRFLHDLGVILNFQGDEKLQDTAILNPLWVTNAVYKILNDNALMTHYRGILYPGMLERILDNPLKYPVNKHQFIIDMMVKFELCFIQENGGDPGYLIPGLLPKGEPYTGDWKDSLAFEYHYNVLPNSIISRFIVRMNHLIHQETYWRSGVVLAYNNHKALVKADKEDKKIFVWIQGNSETSRKFRSLICSTFESIHQTILGIQAQERLVLPNCEPEILIDHQYLLELNRLGEESYIPPGLHKRVYVKEILSLFDENYDSDSSSHIQPTIFELSPILKGMKKFFFPD